MIARCKSCGAEILWIRTSNGKAMPLDAKPEKRIVLDGVMKIAKLVDTYQLHFATCPYAAKHRKLCGKHRKKKGE